MKISQDALMAIYDAAISDNKWSTAMDACTAAMGAEFSLFYEVSIAERVDYSLEKSCTGVERYVDLLAEHTRNRTMGQTSGYEWEGVSFIHKSKPWSVVRDDEIWELSGSYFDRPEISLPLKNNIFRRSFVNLSDDPLSMRGLVFLYGQGLDAKLPADLLSNGPVFAPHVAKAAEIFRLTNGLRQKYHAVLTALDRIATGVLVTSDQGEIVVANLAARELLDNRDGLYTSRFGTLMAREDTANSALYDCISAVSATAVGENDNSGGIVKVPRLGSEAALVAVIAPLRDSEIEIDTGFTGSLITIVDPMRPVKVQTDLLSSAYGFTTAETRVASLLLQGLTNWEISEQIGVGRETVKSQVSTILAKSGCKNRVAFIWRIFQLSPPIE